MLSAFERRRAAGRAAAAASSFFWESVESRLVLNYYATTLNFQATGDRSENFCGGPGPSPLKARRAPLLFRLARGAP